MAPHYAPLLLALALTLAPYYTPLLLALALTLDHGSALCTLTSSPS